MSDKYILSSLWLAGSLGLIGYVGFTKTQAARAAHKVEMVEALKVRMLDAIRAANEGDFAKAARTLEELQRSHPRSTSIALNLGIAYSALELYDEAEEQFSVVLQLNPDDWDAVAERAVIRVLRGDEAAGFDLLETIPAGQGQLDRRLVADPVWLRAKDQERLKSLKAKHRASQYGDSAARRLREMERRRREFEAANVRGARSPANNLPTKTKEAQP